MVRTAFLWLFSAFAMIGCQPDYGIVGEIGTEYVYIEVPKEGPDTEIWVDSFIQPTSMEGVDILWVIDRSGSMSRYNAELLAGIEAMLGALPTADWRLVMINADPDHAVNSTIFPLVPGDDAADAAAMLATLSSAYKEEGFNSVYEYITNNPYSSTWLRPDAGLLVVFVSDEEEQSDIEYPTVAEFMSWYQMQRMGSVFMASIVNQDPSTTMCSLPPSMIDVGERYMEATGMLGGVVVWPHRLGWHDHGDNPPYLLLLPPSCATLAAFLSKSNFMLSRDVVKGRSKHRLRQ